MHELGSGQVHVQKYVEVITQCAEDPHLMLSGLLKGWFPNMFHFNQCWSSLLSLSFFSFCSSPCECYLFNSLPRVFCCFESICKTESCLGSPSLNVDLLGVALMTLKGGITKCKVRHDLHSLLCWQKCCMNMMI